jgi:hypothetical protein
MMRIRAVYERAAADTDAEMAIKLDKLVESLDRLYPDWRAVYETGQE